MELYDPWHCLLFTNGWSRSGYIERFFLRRNSPFSLSVWSHCSCCAAPLRLYLSLSRSLRVRRTIKSDDWRSSLPTSLRRMHFTGSFCNSAAKFCSLMSVDCRNNMKKEASTGKYSTKMIGRLACHSGTLYLFSGNQNLSLHILLKELLWPTGCANTMICTTYETYGRLAVSWVDWPHHHIAILRSLSLHPHADPSTHPSRPVSLLNINIFRSKCPNSNDVSHWKRGLSKDDFSSSVNVSSDSEVQSKKFTWLNGNLSEESDRGELERVKMATHSNQWGRALHFLNICKNCVAEGGLRMYEDEGRQRRERITAILTL